MATHSSILAWEIPWQRSLVGYSPWGQKELDTTEHTPASTADLQCCVSFRCTEKWFRYTHTYISFFRLFFPPGYYKIMSIVWHLLLNTNIHLHLPFCRTSFWSEPRTSLKPSTVSPGIPARSQLSPAPRLTVAWWASIHMAASSGSASQSQHRETIKVLPFSDSKYRHLMHLKDWLCWSWKKWTFDSYVMKRGCPTHNQANQNDCLKETQKKCSIKVIQSTRGGATLSLSPPLCLSILVFLLINTLLVSQLKKKKKCVLDKQCSHWIILTLDVLLDFQLFKYQVESFNGNI